MGEDLITATQCGYCHRIYPCIHRENAPIDYKALFDWLKINGYSILCQDCTDENKLIKCGSCGEMAPDYDGGTCEDCCLK
jgi:hypothetical protein